MSTDEVDLADLVLGMNIADAMDAAIADTPEEHARRYQPQAAPEEPLPAEPGPLDLEAIRTRVDAATKGPWSVDEPKGGFWQGPFGVICQYGVLRREGDRADGPRVLLTLNGNFEPGGDAAFIAHARTDVPALLDALEELESEIAEARAAVTAGVEAVDKWQMAATMGDAVIAGLQADLSREKARADLAERQRDAWRERHRRLHALGLSSSHDDHMKRIAQLHAAIDAVEAVDPEGAKGGA